MTDQTPPPPQDDEPEENEVLRAAREQRQQKEAADAAEAADRDAAKGRQARLENRGRGGPGHRVGGGDRGAALREPRQDQVKHRAVPALPDETACLIVIVRQTERYLRIKGRPGVALVMDGFGLAIARRPFLNPAVA